MEDMTYRAVRVLKEADLIFMPIAPDVAYKFGELNDPLKAYLSDIYTIGVNLAGLPAISVPVARNSQNLNISAQLIGRAYDEQTVLDGGLNLETIVRG
jgi:aspartyl-tRNA(Asn)/glutamyl-tRNA(Gln) amidotransferase subunit A